MNAAEKEICAIVLAAVKPREAVAVWMRLGFDSPAATFAEIGAELGVSVTRASAIFDDGVRRARNRMAIVEAR